MPPTPTQQTSRENRKGCAQICQHRRAQREETKHLIRQEVPSRAIPTSNAFADLARIPWRKPNRPCNFSARASSSKRRVRTKKTHSHSKIWPPSDPTRCRTRLELGVLLDLRAVVLSREDLGDGEPVRVSAEKRGKEQQT